METEARLIRWGGWAALASVAVAVAAMVGVVAIGAEPPESRRDVEALVYYADNQGVMAWMTWLSMVGWALAIAAFLGFHAALRATRLPLIIGTVSAIIGMMFWIVWAVLHLAVIYDVAPAYAAAGAASQPAIEAAGRGMLTVGVVSDIVGFAFFGFGLLLVSLASLETRAVPGWLGWLGLAVVVVSVVSAVGHWVDPLIWVELFVWAPLLLIWFAGMGIQMVRGKVPAAVGAGGTGHQR